MILLGPNAIFCALLVLWWSIYAGRHANHHPKANDAVVPPGKHMEIGSLPFTFDQPSGILAMQLTTTMFFACVTDAWKLWVSNLSPASALRSLAVLHLLACDRGGF